LEQPDILGWSFGGFIVLTVVVNYGDLVNRVVLADTTSGGVLGKRFHISLLLPSPVLRRIAQWRRVFLASFSFMLLPPPLGGDACDRFWEAS